MARSLEIKGLKEAIATLRAMPPGVQKGLAAGLLQAGEEIMTEAKQQTPVDEGTLRSSGTVYPPKVDARKVTVLVGFGGAAKEYAIAVHEYPQHAPPSWAGGVSFRVGGPKFLERPTMRHAKTLGKTVAPHVLRQLRKTSR